MMLTRHFLTITERNVAVSKGLEPVFPPLYPRTFSQRDIFGVEPDEFDDNGSVVSKS